MTLFLVLLLLVLQLMAIGDGRVWKQHCRHIQRRKAQNVSPSTHPYVCHTRE